MGSINILLIPVLFSDWQGINYFYCSATPFAPRFIRYENLRSTFEWSVIAVTYDETGYEGSLQKHHIDICVNVPLIALSFWDYHPRVAHLLRTRKQGGDFRIRNRNFIVWCFFRHPCIPVAEDRCVG